MSALNSNNEAYFFYSSIQQTHSAFSVNTAMFFPQPVFYSFSGNLVKEFSISDEFLFYCVYSCLIAGLRSFFLQVLKNLWNLQLWSGMQTHYVLQYVSQIASVRTWIFRNYNWTKDNDDQCISMSWIEPYFIDIFLME